MEGESLIPCQPNLVYLCGPHGSGKTTLGEALAKENPDILIPELYSRNIKFNTDPGYRHVLKICGRAIENYEYLDIARKNPERIILANRCVYDNKAYNEVYQRKGWITPEILERYTQYNQDFFQHENAAPYAIVLNPGFEAVMAHLEKRWNEKGNKWGEDDSEYTRLACEAYEQYKENSNVLYIDHEIALESRTEIREANEWICRVIGRVPVLQA